VKNRGSYPESSIPRNIPRPGHSDYAAYKKFGDSDMRIYAEGASARRTAGTVAAGALLKSFLELKGVNVDAFVESVGSVKTDVFSNCYTTKIDLKKLKKEKNKNSLYIPDDNAFKCAKELIETASNNGESLGGTVKIFVSGVVAGIGNFSTPTKRLDALLCANMISIPSAKGVFIGNENIDKIEGSKAHDEFYMEDGEICRKTNNAGGVEAGITNSEDIIITVHFKPIPSLKKSIDSVDIEKNTEAKTKYVRSDVTAIAPAVLVCESIAAISVFDSMLLQGHFF